MFPSTALRAVLALVNFSASLLPPRWCALLCILSSDRTLIMDIAAGCTEVVVPHSFPGEGCTPCQHFDSSSGTAPYLPWFQPWILFFFLLLLPFCVGWGVALSCSSCGLGGWWWGENRGSGSALAANSAQDRVRSRHSVVRLRTLYSPPWDHPRARSSACIGHGAQSNPVGLRHRRRRRWHYVSGQLLAAVAIEWKGSRRATAEHSRSRNATTWAGLLEACSRQLNAQLRQLWIWWHHCTGLYPTRCWRMHVFAGVRHAPWVAYRTGLHCWHWATADRAIGQISASFLPYRLQHTVVRGPWL